MPMIRLPPATLPVKQTCRIRGSPTTIGPSDVVGAGHDVQDSRAAARAVRWRSVLTAESGVVGGGLTITVFPAISA